MLLKTFSTSVEEIKWFFTLLLLMCYINFNDFHMLNHPCFTGMKPIRSWWMIFLTYCWVQFVIALLMIFASMFIGNWPVVLLYRCVLFQFWDECYTGSIKWVRQCSFPFCFMVKFKECLY
jgi:hypothetical protein